jgi:PAS domain S-box-containing protein
MVEPPGGQCYVLWTLVPEFGPEGTVQTVLSIGRDFTDRKRAENALQRSEERLRALFEKAKDAIFLLQAEGEAAGRVLNANQAAADMHGYTIAELQTMHIKDLDSPDDARHIPSRIARIMDGEWIKQEISHRRKDGSIFPVEISSGLIQDGDQKFILCFDRDISERKKAGDEITTLNRNLQQHLQELRVTNKELEAFTYSVSHDLRAPLRSIKGFSSFLLHDYQASLDDRGKQYLDRVIQNTIRMDRLIEDLLHLSRISRHQLERVEIDMSRIVHELALELRNGQPARAVSLDIREGLRVKADPRLIRLALGNLLNNAWKFTSKTESPRIEFGVCSRDGMAAYFLRDNGAGFDHDYADKLFLPFHRLHSEQEFEGNGIGLAIVDRVIRKHRGRVWAEGRPDEGAVFYFTLHD